MAAAAAAGAEFAGALADTCGTESAISEASPVCNTASSDISEYAWLCPPKQKMSTPPTDEQIAPHDYTHTTVRTTTMKADSLVTAGSGCLTKYSRVT